MADLTGKTIANTYKDLLQTGTSGTGLPVNTPVNIQDGQGNPSGLKLSLNQIDLTGTVKIKGTELTANVSALNAISDFTAVSGFAAGNGVGTIVGRTFSASTGISISNADGISGPPVFSLAATSVSAGTYNGYSTQFIIDGTGRVTDINTTDTVSVNNVNAANIDATTGQFSGDVSIGGSLNFTGALAVASLSVTGDIHGNNVNVSTVFADGLQVTNAVCATSFHGSGAALTSITASSATNASYAASAGEAALAVSAHHASSATFATSANNATFAVSATNATSAVFASSATNATSAVFATSAINATNAINVDYGGVVETSSANLGTVSASDMFVSGPVSVGGTFDVSGAVSIGGGLFVVGDVSAGNIHAGGIIYGNGAGLFNVPSESGGTVNFVKAGTGIHTIVDGTTTTNPISASGTLALDADQSFGTVSATAFVIGGDNVAMSATVASLSATMATSIDNTNTNITTNTNAITSINSVTTSINSNIASVSSALATSINNTNSNVTALSATMATSIANHLPLAGGTLTGTLTLSGAPSANLEAATKQYVDNLTNAAIHFHDAVRVESPDSAGNLNATYDNGTAGVGATLTNAGTQAALVIDGVTLNTSDRVLIYNQTDATQNGVYTVTDTGSVSTNWVLTRATDADSYEPTTADGLDGGSYFYVQEGNSGAGEAYVCNNVGTITFGTTDITFVQFSSALVYTAGSGININASRVISTSGVPTNADLTALSATMATSINNTNTNVTALSATMATSIATQSSAITSINSKIAAVSGALATSIGNSNSSITALSATMATSINNTNTNVTTNTNAITSINNVTTSINSKIASVSSGLATSISTVNTRVTNLSATFATSINNSNTNITTNTNAITSINSKIAAVSGALATSIGNTNTNITALSATLATSIANQATDARLDAVSATLATSIANQMPKSGGTFTGSINLGNNAISDVETIYLDGQLISTGDSDTYWQFVNANEARVVTGGSENIRFRSAYIQAYENVQPSVETATKTGAVTPDLQNYNSFVWTLTGNITLNNPSTELTGFSGVFIFIHSGAGRTVSLGTDWETAGASGLTLSGTAGAVDIVPYFVQASGNILLGTPQLAFS